jgi:hypothetical protein
MMFFNKLASTENPNKKWEHLYKTKTMTIQKKRIFTENDRFFTIGSCFAEEIRKSLTGQGFDCLPRYRDICFDPSHSIVDTLPKREHMNFYSSFSIRQELERALGLWTPDKSDYWSVSNRKIVDGKLCISEDRKDIVYQDPYRRLVFSDSTEIYHALNSKISEVFLNGLKEATVFIATFGMTEVFVKKDNGRICNQIPVYGGGGGFKETEFKKSSFIENLANIESIVELARYINKSLKIVFSVSPVPMNRSFAGNDVFVGNYASKCTLRAVIEEVCDRHKDVLYFPSFEVVWGLGAIAFKDEDLLHVKPSIVEEIIRSFKASYF